jgi:hypothetical protein
MSNSYKLQIGIGFLLYIYIRDICKYLRMWSPKDKRSPTRTLQSQRSIHLSHDGFTLGSTFKKLGGENTLKWRFLLRLKIKPHLEDWVLKVGELCSSVGSAKIWHDDDATIVPRHVSHLGHAPWCKVLGFKQLCSWLIELCQFWSSLGIGPKCKPTL